MFRRPDKPVLENSIPIQKVLPMRILTCMSLGLASLVSAYSQTTTTMFATSINAPGGGVILAGSAIALGSVKPVRHLWSADGKNGLCRIDPDVDTPGNHSINSATCVRTAAGIRLKPGQVTFDPSNNDLYMVDGQGKSVGIFRFRYLPAGDSGQGLMNPSQQRCWAAYPERAVSAGSATMFRPR
jgi:hypothetical protein